MPDIFKYIVASSFIADYCPTIKNYKKKLSGKNSNGNKIDFTEADKQLIREGLNKLFKDLSKPD